MKSKLLIILLFLACGLDVAPANEGDTEPGVPFYSKWDGRANILVDPDVYEFCMWWGYEKFSEGSVIWTEELACKRHDGRIDVLFTLGQPQRT